jgi:hypothetical protein
MAANIKQALLLTSFLRQPLAWLHAEMRLITNRTTCRMSCEPPAFSDAPKPMQSSCCEHVAELEYAQGMTCQLNFYC